MYRVFFFFILIVACSSPSDLENKPSIDFCSVIHKRDTISLSSHLQEYDELMFEKTGVYVLEDGGGSLVTRAWLTEYSEETIDIQYFIFSTDNVGLIAIDYLVRAADRGVKVRLLLDDIMIDADIEDVILLDEHRNIDIKIYNPGVNLGKSIFSKIKKFTTEFRSANQRMHNKTFVVDGKVCITGGRNIADEYFDYDHEYNFRDRDVLLIGKSVKDVNTSFSVFWNNKLSVDVSSLAKEKIYVESSVAKYEKLHQYACNPDNFWPQIRSKIENFSNTIDEVKSSGRLLWVDNVDFISDKPGKNDGSYGLGGGGLTTSKLIDLVSNAKKSVLIQSPYLVTTNLSKNLFTKVVNKGVKVKILTNSLASTDNLEAFASYQKDRKKLLKTGVNIFEFKPDAEIRRKIMSNELQKTLDFTPIFGLHAKTMVIDNEIVIIGTFNIDPRSANLNTECITIIYSKEIADLVLKGMNEEFLPQNSWEITQSFNPDKEVKRSKRIKTWTRKILPKNIL